MINFSKDMKPVRLSNAVAAGQTTVTTAVFTFQGLATAGKYTNWPAGGTVAPSQIPMGFDGIAIIVLLNTVVATATITVVLQDNSVNSAGGMANVAAVSADFQSNNTANASVIQAGSNAGLAVTDIGGLTSNSLIVLDVVLTQLPFYQVTITRGVANSALDGVIGILYRGEARPVIADTSVSAQGFFVAGS